MANFTQYGLHNFFRNRFLRVYPLFLLVSVVSWITVLIISKRNPLPLFEIPAQLFAIQWNHDYILVGVFWALGIIIQFYLIAPIMVWLLIKSKRIWPIGAFFLYIVPSVWLLISIILFNASPDSRNILGNLSHFVVGVAACFYTEMQNKSKVSFLKPLGKSLILIGGFFVLLCMVNYIYHANQLLFWYGGGELLVDLAILIIILAHDCFKQMDISVSPLIKLLSAFGVLSFGIYAWHGYVLTYYPLISDNFIIVLGVSLLLSWVSYTCIEVPISRFRRA